MKKKPRTTGAVCQEYPSSSSCAHHFLPFGAGDIGNICLQMQWEEDSLLPSLLSRGPSGFPASSFLIALLPGTPVNSNPHPAVQVRQPRGQFLQPSGMAGTSPPVPALPRPFGHGSPSCHTQLPQGGEDTDTHLIFIQNPVLHELSHLLFSMAMQCTVTLPLGLSN